MIELISFNFAILKGNKFRQPTIAELQKSANSGYSYASNLSRFESYLISNGIYVGSKSPSSYSMMAKFKKASPTALQMNFMAQQTVQMGKSLGKQ